MQPIILTKHHLYDRLIIEPKLNQTMNKECLIRQERTPGRWYEEIEHELSWLAARTTSPGYGLFVFIHRVDKKIYLNLVFISDYMKKQRKLMKTLNYRPLWGYPGWQCVLLIIFLTNSSQNRTSLQLLSLL